ncbi:MAG TPA: DoxX family protein, partial [Candidatus Krumholzibacterium sp.]|nr:DoxX family protein [Candidatus Krumholzibacterium sp.]
MKDHLLLVARIVLALVFIYAALQKIDKPLLFADEIRMYGVIDRGPFLYLMAIVLPWVEILCGVSLLTGLLMRG